MSRTRQHVGKRGEALARRYLEARGYRLLETNYRGKSGEVDLIADHGGTLVFVEVRSRRAWGFGQPEESITTAKGRRLAATAHEYLDEHNMENVEWRIDVVVIEMAGVGRKPRIELIKNAIEDEDPDAC